MQRKKRNRNFLVKNKVCGYFNSFLDIDFLFFYSAGHGVKTKIPYFLDSNIKTTNGVKQIIKENKKKYELKIQLLYKI